MQLASIISRQNSAFHSTIQHWAAFPSTQGVNRIECCEMSNCVAARASAFRVGRPQVGCEEQQSFYETAVVEHKAQTHFEGLLFPSDLRCAF